MTSQRHGLMHGATAAVLAGSLLLGGCSTKSGVVTTSGTEPNAASQATSRLVMPPEGGGGMTTTAKPGAATEPQSAAAGAGRGEAPTAGSAERSPQAASTPATGFSRNPTEEQVTQPAPMVVAKVESPDAHVGKARETAGRQLADIYFAFDKWTLSDEGKKNLTESAEFLKQHPEARLVIEGYCDERGSREYNLVLGEKRAKESLRYLTALGIKNQASITSYGKERSVCKEPNESCYWKNRRGHLVVAEGQR